MANKHTVATDALETLGTIIDERAGRDAIHLAVEPSIAAETLYPGQHVGFVEGGIGRCDKPVGIVDPFIIGTVHIGQRFWLVVYPRQITSLRHVWTHPAFDEAPMSEADTSKAWIEGFATRINQTYSRVIEAASEFVDSGEYTRDDSEAYKDCWDEFPEFWKHYEVVTGRKVPASERGSFFTCSC